MGFWLGSSSSSTSGGAVKRCCGLHESTPCNSFTCHLCCTFHSLSRHFLDIISPRYWWTTSTPFSFDCSLQYLLLKYLLLVRLRVIIAIEFKVRFKVMISNGFLARFRVIVAIRFKVRFRVMISNGFLVRFRVIVAIRSKVRFRVMISNGL